MSSEYKTVIHVSSRVENPRGRTGSDPQAYGAAARLRKNSSPSSSKHSIPTEHIEIGQPCLKCAHKCPGYMQHIWRKQCLHCGCGRGSHSIETEPSSIIPLIEGLTLTGESSKLSRADVDRLRKYAWYPPGLSYGMIEKYMEGLREECVPVVGTEGERYRRSQCFLQLPVYDFSLEACHKMSELETKRHGKITTKRRNESFGIGAVKLQSSEQKKVCAECLQGISMGSVYIYSERAGQDKRWHPACFRCNTCHELLVDLIHYHSPEHEGIYCGRHHLELFVPRCAGCDEVILATHFTEAVGRNWHKKHFCCADCDDQLVGKSSTSHEGKSLCNRCFGKYAPNCHRCKKVIGIDQKKMSVKGKNYHRECFVCKRCREDLIGERYFIIDDDIICSDCTKPIGQCQGCKEGIKPSVSYLKHGDRCWHADCFKCSVCRAWLVDGQFHEMASSIMCNACYTEKTSPKCAACLQIIKEKGVTFSLKSYHLDCFVCTSCKEPLMGQNGKVKECNRQPYCQSCVDKTYKKCYKCGGTITMRHTVYNGHTFHLQCFKCTKCGRTIDRGEFFEGNSGEIMCPRCTD